MTAIPHHRTDCHAPFAALLIAVSMALAMLSFGSIRNDPPNGDPIPAVTPAPGFH
ncbi:MAG TPA: hypothetical protein VF119_01770 [Candidatus Limnocylindrales bacterium]